jgi:hypothetical protein
VYSSGAGITFNGKRGQREWVKSFSKDEFNKSLVDIPNDVTFRFIREGRVFSFFYCEPAGIDFKSIYTSIINPAENATDMYIHLGLGNYYDQSTPVPIDFSQLRINKGELYFP